MTIRTHAPGASARRAFTLIELLVVISIIGLMTGLIVAGAMKFKDVSRANAADNQVSRYQTALETEYKNVVRQCAGDPPAAVVSYCGGDVERARAVHTAATLKVNFPESFAEATAAPMNIGGQQYISKSTFASVGGGAAAPTTTRNPPIAAADYERAVLLYLIIQEKATAGSGTDTGGTGEVRSETFGTKTLSYFIDSYGYPLIYYRWADGTINAELDAAPYVAASAGTKKDPLDPKGLVSAWDTTGVLSKPPYNLRFNNANRLPTVIGFGRNQSFNNCTGDDVVGYRLARFGNKGNGK